MDTKVIGFLVIGLVIGLGVGYAIPVYLLAPAPPAEEVDLLQTIIDRGYINVGTSSGWPPFEMINTTTSELYGFDIELVEMVVDFIETENSATITVEWSDLAFDSLVGACSAGTIDLIAAATFIEPDRTEVLAPSQWYIRTNMVLVVKNDSTLTATSYDDLDGYTVGVQTGTAEDYELDDHNTAGGSVTIQRYTRPDTMFADLEAGTIDAVFVDEPVLLLFSELYVLKTILTITAPPTAFFMRYGDPDFRRAVDDAIASFFADGSMDTLIAKWFG
ncbi:MAG: substrate-binding periplasmic protein [Candidatus Thorarchaeota archaeon]